MSGLIGENCSLTHSRDDRADAFGSVVDCVTGGRLLDLRPRLIWGARRWISAALVPLSSCKAREDVGLLAGTGAADKRQCERARGDDPHGGSPLARANLTPALAA
jgi:hypothetical protein